MAQTQQRPAVTSRRPPRKTKISFDGTPLGASRQALFGTDPTISSPILAQARSFYGGRGAQMAHYLEILRADARALGRVR